MARIGINTGSAANDNTGSTLRAAGGIINDNFSEIYTYFGDGTNLTSIGGTWAVTSVGIHTLKNVGIGTTNPTSALTVTGNGTFTGVVTATTFIGALTGTASTASFATTSFGLSGTPNLNIGILTATRLNVGTSGTVITTTASGLVGIGTTNPRFLLEVGAVGASGTTLFVNGDARVTGILTIGTASITLNGATNIINVGTGITINGSTGIISATAIVLGGTTLTGAAVTFITAGSGISVNQGTGNVTITATGGGGSSQWVTTAAGIHTLSNVGIGTTNPTSALTVTGNGTFTGVVTATTFVGALTGTATTATNSQGLTGTPDITVGVATASTLNVGTSGTIITTTTSGLVGIGTIYPTSALTVVGASGTTLLVTGGNIPIQIGGPNVTGTIFKVGEINLSGPDVSDINATYFSNIRYSKVGDYRYNLEFHSGGYTGYGGPAPAGGPGDFIFYKRTDYYGRVERFRISGETGDITSKGAVIAETLNVGTGGTIITTTTSGLVGIGTIYPTSALTVKGNTSLETLNVTGVSTFGGDGTNSYQYFTSINAYLDFTSTFNVRKDGVTYISVGGNTAALSENTTINGAYYRIRTLSTGAEINGNLGINTATPSSELHVVGNARVSGISTLGTVQISSGIVTATSGIVTYYGDTSNAADGRWTLGANGSSDYTFTGIGFTQTTNDPVLYLARGRVYEFVNNSGGSHPFQIRVSNGGAAYSDGVINNSAASGVIRFEVPFSAPNTLYYQCTNHSGMGNTISVYPSTI